MDERSTRINERSTPSQGASAQPLLRELRDAAQLLDELESEARGAHQAQRLAVAHRTLDQAIRAIEHHDEALHALADSVRDLGRQLIDSHARFGEWMSDPDRRTRSPCGDR